VNPVAAVDCVTTPLVPTFAAAFVKVASFTSVPVGSVNTKVEMIVSPSAAASVQVVTVIFDVNAVPWINGVAAVPA